MTRDMLFLDGKLQSLLPNNVGMIMLRLDRSKRLATENIPALRKADIFLTFEEIKRSDFKNKASPVVFVAMHHFNCPYDQTVVAPGAMNNCDNPVEFSLVV